MEIDVRAKSFAKDQAIEVLQSIYEIYFGRTVDLTGKQLWTPIIEKYGFQGLVFVLYQLVQSEEMNNRVQEDLSRLYRDYLGRDVDPAGRQAHDLPVRFFRERGREGVIERMRKSPEYVKRRLELKPDEEKIETISLQIKQGNISGETYAELAKLNAKVQRYEAAVEAYTQAIILVGDPGYYFERGNLRFKLGKYQEAIDDFKTALEKGYRPDGDVHFKIAQTLEMLGELKQSVQEYETAAASMPQGSALAWYQLAIVQQKLGTIEKGIESFTKALDTNPDEELEARILVERGRAYVRSGQTEAAGKDFSIFVGRSHTWKRLIQANTPTIYFVHDRIKYPIPDPPTLNYVALEQQLQILERVSTIELNAYPEGRPIASILSLRLVQGPKDGDGASFLVENGRRRWIPNPDTFGTLGLDMGKLEILSHEKLAEIPLGPPIRNVLGKQPLKRSQSTGNYFILEKEKRRVVPNIQTLTAMGYSAEEAEEIAEEMVTATEKGDNIPDLSGVVGS